MKDCDEGKDVYKCRIWTAAEGVCEGTIYLTRDQYNTIKYAADMRNWKDVSDEGWSGGFGIWCECFE